MMDVKPEDFEKDADVCIDYYNLPDKKATNRPGRRVLGNICLAFRFPTEVTLELFRLAGHEIVLTDTEDRAFLAVISTRARLSLTAKHKLIDALKRAK
jgi:hypothetical protein